MFKILAIKEVSYLVKEINRELTTIEEEVVEGLEDLFQGQIVFWRRKGRGGKGNLKNPTKENKRGRKRNNPPDRPLKLKTSYFQTRSLEITRR